MFCHFIELPRAAIRILSNVTFLFVSLSYTAESAIVTAFITFIPKFIESQFGIPASNASIYTGKALPLARKLVRVSLCFVFRSHQTKTHGKVSAVQFLTLYFQVPLKAWGFNPKKAGVDVSLFSVCSYSFFIFASFACVRNFSVSSVMRLSLSCGKKFHMQFQHYCKRTVVTCCKMIINCLRTSVTAL